jgi:hypothetical protein
MSYAPMIREYLQLLEQFQTDEAKYHHLLHPQIEQTEFPNALNRNGQKSDWADLFRRMKLAPTILSQQRYAIQSISENKDTAVVETKWTGVMGVDAGPLKKGQELRAHICLVLEFKGGLIFRQRNYDCFESF